MNSAAVAPRPPITRDQLAALVGHTMGLVAATVGAFALGAYVGRDWSDGWSLLPFLASFLLLLGINVAAKRSEGLALAMLLGFGLLIGLSVAPTLSYYAQMDAAALWQAGAATALFIAGVGAAGYGTRRDLSSLARSLSWALVTLIVFGVVLILVGIPGGSTIYAVLGLVIFAGLTAFDFQRLRRNKDIRTAPLLAASIFLDILNVFLLLLDPFSGSGK